MAGEDNVWEIRDEEIVDDYFVALLELIIFWVAELFAGFRSFAWPRLAGPDYFLLFDVFPITDLTFSEIASRLPLVSFSSSYFDGWLTWRLSALAPDRQVVVVTKYAIENMK